MFYTRPRELGKLMREVHIFSRVDCVGQDAEGAGGLQLYLSADGCDCACYGEKVAALFLAVWGLDSNILYLIVIIVSRIEIKIKKGYVFSFI